MPLLRGMARTAVISGTATAVSNRVSRRQAERWAGQGQMEPEPVAAPAPASAPDPVAQLERLGELRTKGLLTDEEFAAEKAKILNA